MIRLDGIVYLCDSMSVSPVCVTRCQFLAVDAEGEEADDGWTMVNTIPNTSGPDHVEVESHVATPLSATPLGGSRSTSLDFSPLADGALAVMTPVAEDAEFEEENHPDAKLVARGMRGLAVSAESVSEELGGVRIAAVQSVEFDAVSEPGALLHGGSGSAPKSGDWSHVGLLVPTSGQLEGVGLVSHAASGSDSAYVDETLTDGDSHPTRVAELPTHSEMAGTPADDVDTQPRLQENDGQPHPVATPAAMEDGVEPNDEWVLQQMENFKGVTVRLLSHKRRRGQILGPSRHVLTGHPPVCSSLVAVGKHSLPLPCNSLRNIRYLALFGSFCP